MDGIIFVSMEFPFILPSLLFLTQAAIAAPVIMMSQNRQNERDKKHAVQEYKMNNYAKHEI